MLRNKVDLIEEVVLLVLGRGRPLSLFKNIIYPEFALIYRISFN